MLTSVSAALALAFLLSHIISSKGKVFELCLAEIEKRAPAGASEAPADNKCVIM